MKQRPILVAVIGYMIGILGGLYFSSSIVLCHILLLATFYFIKKILNPHKKQKFKLLSIKRYSRYLKLIIDSKVIFIFILFSSISNTIVLYQNNLYEKMYQDGENLTIMGIIISEKIEKQYYDLYQVKGLKTKKFNFFIEVSKKIDALSYGDKIQVQGIYKKPSKQRNYGGYDEEQYQKTLKIIGKIKVKKIQKVNAKQRNPIFQLANQTKLKMEEKIEQLGDKEKVGILKGLLLGKTSQIEESMKQDFQDANISHVLAISGMHIAYLIMGLQYILSKPLGKNKAKIVILNSLIFYAFLTGFSPSVVRAVGMSIIAILAGMLHRKNDTINAIAICLLVNLILNPFSLLKVGLQLSYLGTIGIIFFHHHILKVLNHSFFSNKSKILDKIKEMIAVSLAAQIMLFPILLYHFNSYSIYFILTNLMASIIIGPILMLGLVSLFSKTVFPFLKIGLGFLLFISKFARITFCKDLCTNHKYFRNYFVFFRNCHFHFTI